MNQTAIPPQVAERLSIWLEARAGSAAPDYLEDVLASLDGVRQRPAWSSPGRWLPMQLTLPRVAVPRFLPIAVVIALLIAALVVAALFVGSRQPLPPPFGLATTGQFVFDAGGEIVVTDPTGSDRLVLSSPDRYEFGPTFAPDGTRIAFWSRTGTSATADLMVMDADGAGRRVVATRIVPDQRASAPAWSPDGTMLAFVDTTGVLERVRVDGTERLRLGRDGPGRYYVRWSPDGRRLAYVMGSDAGGTLHVIDADGANETRVGTSIGGLAEWSHDGKKLYYFAPVGPGDLMVAVFDGAAWSESVLLGESTDDVLPRLSNDGTRLAFLRLDASSRSVMVIGTDGTGLRSLTEVLLGLTFAVPCWSPDDRSIAALMGPPEPAGFVIVPTDGSPIRRTPASGIKSIDACNWQRLAP